MPLNRRTLIAASLSITFVLAPLTSVFAASPAPAKGEHGMVVTAQHLASEVGIDVLKRGGNAVDAAVAVGYALAVVYPNAGNIGGGGFMTIRFKDGKSTFLDFRERAPLAATKTMYLDKDGNPVKGASLDGYLAVGVPGSVAGFEMAREKYGKLSRQDLMAPAIGYAKDGFILNQGDAASFAGSADRLAKDPAAAAIFLKPDGKPYGIGERLVQPDLAASLAAISEKGTDAFYKGAIADAIIKASGAKGGILAKPDFEQYAVRELKPVTCTYRGYEITSSPPPSSGGLIICEILNVLEGYPLSYLGAGSAETVHVMVEAMRYAYVDRNSALGDPDFVDNPVSKLLDKAYAKDIRDKIDPFRAGVSQDLMPKGFGESKETTHYSIIDDAGNAVAVTYTLNGSFGAGVVADGTGILLNNEMDDFTQKPGVPNLYGLVQGEANAIQPKKTPLSSMSPTVVAKDGKPFMVIGSPGGSRIITITLEAIVNVIDHGMNIQEAIDAPRIHHQWLPDKVYVEPFGLSPDTEKLLAGMGYHLDLADQTWGQAAGILVGGKSLAEIEKGGGARYNGAIDSRAASGEALGY
ncbi:gamma-glutamyltransferase [Mesorhizobium sp. M7A.F.Ca.CA.001.09.2.1]|uniref:Glutathione hydrolase proenzyme n=3 Tax=Mesorhizobium TaxID=68287 RepID=A0AB38TA22_9HYPH|nr:MULTISPECIES: gamma-glutamyltransferase [Mesorhizobium]RUY57990.1 gamma-glutamyltransferase [Mesorhizobium sp. M7A.F.Ca.CA.001.13.2.1]MDF3214849.1 gamma-glutamyltransferase [Mesorhizobium ciceri]RUY71761.1 gamma-glutamyltransferase [Mesorhizobium sp. M7A.F.Ca.CA.001.13.1.1]RUY81290.1 gamma-glutamyltransferase [Mesorhizobium sp. M7A.F.Ca.CA.001.09.2.1]RUZ06263.1 gamma-glutamyltransferase [Mesorhizobium sp. M7A.F.Ca.CA.001.04.2.1]